MLKEVGWAAPLVAYESGGSLVVLDGHLRRSLDPEARVPLVVLDVTDEEADKILATLDPIGAMASADRGALSDLLATVKSGSEDVRRMLSELLATSSSIKVPKDPEHVPAAKKLRSALGELYELGSHRLAVADTQGPKVLERLVGEEKVRLLLTDMPYGVDVVGRGPEALQIEGDTPEGLPDLLRRSFAAIDKVLLPGAGIYLFHPSGPNVALFFDAIRNVGWSIRQDIYWVKDSLVLSHLDYHARAEPIAYCYKPGAPFGRGRSGWYGSDSEASVIECPRPKASPLHPSTKPTAILERLIQNSSAPGDVVLDPFIGAGGVFIAAERTARRCFGVEISPHYADVAIARFESYSGTKARRIG